MSFVELTVSKGNGMQQTVALSAGEVGYSVHGDGPPVVVLHRDVVVPGKSPFIASLADRHTVYALDLPGFGSSPRPAWMRTVTQMATLTGHAIATLGLGECPLIGLGFGGWVAADLATQGCAGRFSEVLLVSPWGVKPSSGEISDFVLFDLGRWASLGFHDPARYVELCGDPLEYELMRSWDTAREAVSAVAWKPIGHSRPLRAMVSLIDAPTLVVWGADDAIVPPSCIDDWASAMPSAKTVVVPEAGHQVELEATSTVAQLAYEFFAANKTLEPR
jgi:pimeloyl-ACP methyl ester carboxylesterase